MMDVTLETFETEVAAASAQVPVLVDFWAPWCQPCKTLGPMLEELEVAYAGRFKLAKVNTEQEPQLAAMFGVRNLPTCVLLMNGQPVDGFMGVQPASQLRAFLDRHLPSVEELQAQTQKDEAQTALAEGDTDAALDKLQQALAADPANDDARFDCVRLLLQLGRNEEAAHTFAPAQTKADQSPRLRALQVWLNAIEFVAANAFGGDKAQTEAAFATRLAANKRDFDTRFARARWLMAHQRWQEAMDELLEILMRDKSWSNEAARKAYVAVLEIITPPPPKVAEGHIPPQNPVVASYRRRLSSVVLS